LHCRQCNDAQAYGRRTRDASHSGYKGTIDILPSLEGGDSYGATQ